LLVLLAVAIGAGAWAAGLIRVRAEQGVVQFGIGPRSRVSVTLDFRDSWLLLVLALGLGWAVATAVHKSAWVAGSERLVPGLAVATVGGWLLAARGLPGRRFSVVSAAGTLVYLVLATLDAVRLTFAIHLGSAPIEVLVGWVVALFVQPQFGPLIGLLALVMVTGLWTSWWVFRRRAGLQALAPSGTILTVEILNDPNPGLYFFTLTWLACGILLLLRLNYVALKERWRSQRLPRAADTTWTFGEVGFEATALLLVVAFLLPPLSFQDFSSYLLPGSARSSQIFHPFNIGAPSRAGSAEIGYSETVRPGFQLRAKPSPIMTVTGQFGEIGFYPYWRGIALGAWDGIQWSALPSTIRAPVREQPRLEPKETLPRDDLPGDSRTLSFVQNTFHVVARPDQTLATAFSGGEIISVDKHPVSIRGEMTSQPPSRFGQVEPVNVAAGVRLPFDTVDRVRFVDNPHQPYDYTVYSAIPAVDEKSLREVRATSPGWVQPYTQVYAGGRPALGYSIEKDKAIDALAQKIVADARATNPYDQARAIEQWFRDKDRFSYTLTPPQAPPGVRPLDYFLFASKKGYCQDFSTAMAVMLRSLHLPARQMSGFALGGFDERSQKYLVRATDAHTWVEVYFPGYGWIPFEPTPDDVNFPINRPATPEELTPAGSASTSGAGRDERAGGAAEDLVDESSGAGGAGIKAVWSKVWPVALGALVALLLAAIAVSRWLFGVRDLPRIWRRLWFLGDRLEVPRRPGDTPNEYGVRLARAAPEIEREVRVLARLYTRARFRRGGLESIDVGEVHRAWSRVRRRYAGLVAGAWRARLLQGRRVSPVAASGSRSPVPEQHRGPSSRSLDE